MNHTDPVAELAKVVRVEFAAVTQKLIFLSREINLLKEQFEQAQGNINKLQQAMSNHRW